jgi:DNA-binding beta-propeller fold protein YncE
MLYVGHGGSDAANPARVAVVDTKDFTLAANVHVAAHPEAIDLDEQGQRVFANIADAAQVAVINARTNTVESTWKLRNGSDNTPMAYDAENRLLFIACRKPAVVLALDASSGKELGRLATVGGADDLFYDARFHRVYVIGGAGAVSVYSIDAQKHLATLGTVQTQRGAKTGLFVPTQNLLYVGIPGSSGKPAQIRIYLPTVAAHN